MTRTDPGEERAKSRRTADSVTSLTGYGSPRTPRPPRPRASAPETAGSPTTWRRTSLRCERNPKVSHKVGNNGAITQVVKPAVLSDIAEGIEPERQTTIGGVPFNLMK